MNIDLTSFFPLYPQINAKNFETDLTSKKEFLKLKHFEKSPEVVGTSMENQIDISRFLSSYTPYNEVLLFWDTGTGKTCAAVNVIELLREERKNPPYRGALILVKGGALMKNFKTQLVEKCTTKYKPEDYELLTHEEKVRRSEAKIKDFYHFGTFETFAKHISEKSDEELLKLYDNYVIVIDEVHNLHETAKKRHVVYEEIYRLLHTLKNRKILLMTGTPMKDSPDEFASIINLILPTFKKFPVGEKFIEEYFTQNENGVLEFIKSKEEKFKDIIRGRVSYLKSMEYNVRKEFQENKLTQQIEDLEYYTIYPSRMSEFQEKSYEEARKLDKKSLTQKGKKKNEEKSSVEEDEEKSGIYSNSRQASLFVFPDGMYGDKGFKKYVRKMAENESEKVIKNKKYEMKQNFKLSLLGDDTKKTLEKLRKYSCKYASVIENIQKVEKGCVFIYIDVVGGSGAIVLSKILELFGYSQSFGNEETKKKRYAILTSDTATPAQIKNILDKQNKKENMYGDYIKVIIGSKVTGEGFDIKNVVQTHVLTPHWNFAETYQAMSRTYRIGSHDDLEKVEKNVSLKIFLHCSVGSKIDVEKSLDLKKYVLSETKDIPIKQIERLIKSSAFDCILFHDRNVRERGEDKSRECDLGACDYVCDFEPPEETNENNYSLLYDKTEYDKIIEKLQELFYKNFVMSLDYVFSQLKEISPRIILSTIDWCINKNIEFYNKFGERSYIREDSNILFLFSGVGNPKWIMYYYDENPSVSSSIPFEEITQNKMEKAIPNIIEQFSSATIDGKNQLIKKIPLIIQEMLLEYALLAKNKGIKNKNVVFLLDYFKNYINSSNDEIWVSTLLFEEEKKTMCLDLKSNEWSECDENFIEKLKKKKEKKKKKLEQENPYGYYGKIAMKQGEKVFYIRDVRDKEKIESEDRRKRTIGKKCSSYYRNILAKIAYDLDVPPIKEYKTKSKEELLAMLDKNPRKYRFALTTLDEDPKKGREKLKKLNVNKLRIIMCYSAVPKKDTCVELEKMFESKNMNEVL